MDKRQAEAIAQAILSPGREAQEALLIKRAREAWWHAEKRKVAWLILVGFAVGAAIAYYSGDRFTVGGLWGAISGGAIGWAWVGWRNRRHAA